jgi:hypothetical protein
MLRLPDDGGLTAFLGGGLLGGAVLDAEDTARLNDLLQNVGQDEPAPVVSNCAVCALEIFSKPCDVRPAVCAPANKGIGG